MNVHCTPYTVQCTVYTVLIVKELLCVNTCKMYTVQCTVYILHVLTHNSSLTINIRCCL